MYNRLIQMVLRVSSGLALFFSVCSLMMVASRALDALWQLYMFSGYDTPGVITLSARTGRQFFYFSLLLIASSMILEAVSAMRQLKIEARLARYGWSVATISLGLYGVIAFRPLNDWMA